MRYFVAISNLIEVGDKEPENHINSLYCSHQFNGLLEVDVKGKLIAEGFKLVPFEGGKVIT